MKICLFENCNRFVFSNDYCMGHQYMRTDDKWLNNHNFKPVEPRSFKRSTNVPPKQNNSFKTQLQFSFGFTTQKQMFDFVWSSRPHVCQISGSNLDLVPEIRRHWTMAHIIPKSLYPYFKYNEQNILLISPEAHQLVDNFTEDMREKHKEVDFDKWFSLVDEQKQKYKDFLILNQL